MTKAVAFSNNFMALTSLRTAHERTRYSFSEALDQGGATSNQRGYQVQQKQKWGTKGSGQRQLAVAALIKRRSPQNVGYIAPCFFGDVVDDPNVLAFVVPYLNFRYACHLSSVSHTSPRCICRGCYGERVAITWLTFTAPFG